MYKNNYKNKKIFRWENKRNSPKIVVEETKENIDNTPIDRTNSPRSSPITRLKGEINLPQPQKEKDKYKISKEVEKLSKKEKKEKEKNAQKSSSERIIIGGEESSNKINNMDKGDCIKQPCRLPRELIDQFEGKSREVS